mgnify:CR=1 FL=1
MSRGKKYIQMLEKVDRFKRYPLEEAIELAKETSYAQFDETVELSFRLGVDPRHADQMVRGSVVLPAGTGKKVRVLVITQGEKEKEAEEAGADMVGSDEYLEKIQDGWLDFDLLIATPDMMSKLGKLGKILGPRGLMPSPKTGTVTMDIGKAVKEAKAGKVNYKVDRQGNLHIPIGKRSFSTEDLLANAKEVIGDVKKSRPASCKGQFIRNLVVATTMGPGIKVELSKL